MGNVRSDASGEVVLALAVAIGAAAWVTKGYASTPYDRQFADSAARWGVPADLLRALARHESGFNPRARNDRNDPGEGADVGLMQINERTARALGLDVARLPEPGYSIEAAARLLASIRRELGPIFSHQTWVAAYNAGSGAIRRRGIFNVPYVSAVSYHWQLYQLAGLLQARA